jgi:hypothetical protein
MKTEPKGAEASRLRQRKFQLLRTLKIPAEALPGSLSLTYRRCGKPTCRCAQGEGHPSWSLTFMVGGEKRVEHIPSEWVEEVRRRVELGRHAKETLAEILAANAQLLALERRQRRRCSHPACGG